MRRLLIIAALTTITGCDHGDSDTQEPDLKAREFTQSAKKQEERVVHLVAEILPKYREAGNQNAALDAYLTERATRYSNSKFEEVNEELAEGYPLHGSGDRNRDCLFRSKRKT